MITEKSQAIRRSGMVESHARIFQDVAKEQDVFILCRNLNPLCTSLIADNYPTKGMSVHGKSADWGPQAGFICVDQNLSKYHGHPRVKALNAEVQHSLQPGSDVEEIQLVIRDTRLNELRDKGLLTYAESWITVRHGQQKKGILIKPTNKPVQFQGLPTLDNMYQIFLKGSVVDLGDPVMVIKRARSLTDKPLTDDEQRKPLTADYDLFTVCPNWKNVSLSGADKFPNPHSDLPEHGIHRVLKGVQGPYAAPAAQRMGQTTLKVQARVDLRGGKLSSLEYEFGKAHPVLGHMTVRQDFIRRRLNSEINATYKGGDTVHHGAEVMNPNPETDDFGITMFYPNGEEVRGLENLVDLNEAYWTVKKKGYYFHIHPLWKWQPLAHLGRIEDKLNLERPVMELGHTKHVKSKNLTEAERKTLGRHLPPR